MNSCQKSLAGLVLAVVLARLDRGSVSQKAIANPSTENTTRLPEITKCSQALHNFITQ